MNRVLRRAQRGRRGMTLFEVMVAVVVVLVMALVVWQTVRNASEFNDYVSIRDESTRAARMALGRITRSIELAYLTPSRTGLTPERYQTVFVGLDGDPDTLFFASLAHQRVYMNSREADQSELTFWTEPSPRERGAGYILYMRESGLVDGKPDEGGRIFPLAYNVRSFNVRFLDPVLNEWKDEWDTRSPDTPYRLPRAVEVGLVLIGKDPEDLSRTVDLPFLTRVTLEYAQPITPKYVSLATVATGSSGVSTGTTTPPPLGGGQHWSTFSGSSTGAATTTGGTRNGAAGGAGGAGGARGGSRGSGRGQMPPGVGNVPGVRGTYSGPQGGR